MAKVCASCIQDLDMSHRRREKKSWLQIATEIVQELDFLGYDSTKVSDRGLYGDWYCFDAPGKEPKDILCIRIHRRGDGCIHEAVKQNGFTEQEYEEFERRTRKELEKMLANDDVGVVKEALNSPLNITPEIIQYETPSSWAYILTM